MDRQKTNRKLKNAVLIVCCLVLLAVPVRFAVRSCCRAAYPLKYVDEVEKYSGEYGVPPALLYAVIRTESGFDPNAKSGAGALGLTQILPATFDWLQTKSGEKLETDELFRPDVSIKYGAMFYGMLLREFGEVRTAAAAYHAGRGQVRKWLQDETLSPDGKSLERIPAGRTKDYAEKVLRTFSIYEKLYEKELRRYE